MAKQSPPDAPVCLGVGLDASPTGGGVALEPLEPLSGWELWLAWGVVPVAAVVLGVLAVTGVLSLTRLRDAPARAVGLGVVDVFVGVWLWLAGSLLGGALWVWMEVRWAGVEVEPVVAGVADGLADPVRLVWLQAWAFVPAIGWWVWRMRGVLRWAWLTGWLPERLGRDLLWTALGLPVVVLLFMATQQVSATVAYGLGFEPPMIQHDLLNTYASLRRDGRWSVISGLLFSTVVVAPLLEELFHRGLLQTALVNALQGDTAPADATKGGGGVVALWSVDVSGCVSGVWVRPLAVGLVSVFFMSLHLGVVPWVAVPALVLLSVCFGFLYERTGSLWPPVLVHAGFNGLNVAYVLASA